MLPVSTEPGLAQVGDQRTFAVSMISYGLAHVFEHSIRP